MTDFFNVIRLHRDDFAGFLPEEIYSNFTDSEMESFASTIADGIMEGGDFWTGVDYLAQTIKQERRNII